MKLKTKILFYYVTITVVALFAFGYNSFHIARNAAEDSEKTLLVNNVQIRAQNLIEKLSSNPTRLQLEDYQDRTVALNNEILLVVDANKQLISHVVAHSAADEFYNKWRNTQPQRGELGSISVNSIEFHWIELEVGNSGFKLINAIESHDGNIETAKRLGIRLFAVGSIILWVSVWIILIIATAVSKKLDEQTKALEIQAKFDSLTQLPNRILLMELLSTAVSQSTETKKAVVLIVLDIDRLKEINDTLGHDTGDVVLKLVAERLQATVWNDDTVARLSGDKYAVLLPVADRAHCGLVLDKLIKKLAEPFFVRDAQLEINVTAGVSIYPDDSTQAAELISHAEIAMYEAKQRHDPICYYDSAFNPHSVERLNLISDLRNAAGRNELFLCFQPLIEVKTGRVVGAEALVRWKHPARGLVMPDKFITLAEQTGIIKSMTHYIIEKAVHQSAQWKKQGIQIPVAVNLSARLVHDINIPDVVLQALVKHQLEPTFLELEITETAVMLDPARATDVLNKIDGMGVYLSIDDFGSGYTSLAYLKKLPVDAVKIDRSFVMNMLKDENDALLVRTIIELAHNMGLSVVAEGVENKDILDILASLSCDIAQGYHFTKPLPAEDFEKWLANYNRENGHRRTKDSR